MVTLDNDGVPAIRIRQPLVEDIIGDVVIEHAEIYFQIPGSKGSTKIFLQAEFGFEIPVAYLVLISTGMDPIGGYLGDIRRTVATGDIGFYGELIRKIIGSPGAAR